MAWSKLTTLALGAAVFIGGGSVQNASASPLVDSLTTTAAASGQRSVTSPAFLAESFTGATSLNEVVFNLAVSAAATGSMIVTLYTDNNVNAPLGHAPLSLLGTIASIPDSTLAGTLGTNTFGLIQINNISPLPFANGLTPSSVYWVEVTNTTSGLTLKTGPLNVGAGQTSYDPSVLGLQTTGPWLETCISSADGACATQVTADTLTIAGTVTATPEPATLSIIGTALAGLGVLRRRATKKTTNA